MNIAVIFAGGIGTRMKAHSLPKQFLEISGKPIIIRTLEHFQEHPDIDGIAIAIVAEHRDQMTRLLRRHEISKVRWVVDGGNTGHVSRHRALKAVAQDCPDDTVVLLHDGVRPLINDQVISDNIESVLAHGSGITCTSVYETIVSSVDPTIDGVFARDHMYSVAAPQSFRLGEIVTLYGQAEAEGDFDTRDSCSLMHRYGRKLHRVDGPRWNIKVTTAEDFYLCRTFFEIIENRQIAGL
jgi:D-ribitol-5-phosphate cytidylyltransferase